MTSPFKYRLVFVILTLLPIYLHGQEVDYDALLQRIDTVENPVYKPVVSLSYGILNFYGDVKNLYNTPAIGNSAVRLSVSTFLVSHFGFRFPSCVSALSN